MKPAALVAIVAVLVGVLVGYLVWGAQGRQVEAELGALKARLAEAQEASVREGALASKVQELEAQLKTATENLKTEQETRERLEKLAAKLAPRKQ